MKRIKLLFTAILTSLVFTSCLVQNEIVDDRISLDQLVSSYDLWYIDVHRTTGNGDIPFLQKGKSLPEKDSIAIIWGRKSNTTVFVHDINVLDNKIYMKLSDIK